MPTGERFTLHLENKREAFDGMRAYHTSEIAHKQDAITIFKTILTTTVVIYGGLISTYISTQFSSSIANLMAAIAFLLILILSSITVITTSRKIDRDHDRYEEYKSEYMIERQILGIDEDYSGADEKSQAHLLSKRERTGVGHKYTKHSLRGFGIVIQAVALIGMIIVLVLTQSPEQAIEH